MAKRLHTCMLCEAVCGLAVEMEGASIQSVRGDPEDPFSRGHICPKAAAIVDVQDDPDRIREPQRREGTRWQPVSWDAALDEAGDRLAQVQRKHGRSAANQRHRLSPEDSYLVRRIEISRIEKENDQNSQT